MPQLLACLLTAQASSDQVGNAPGAIAPGQGSAGNLAAAGQPATDAPSPRMNAAVAAPAEVGRAPIPQPATHSHAEPQRNLAWVAPIVALVLLLALVLARRHFELKRLNRALRAARDRIEAAKRAERRYLGDISHEIRTPLNAVLNLTRLGLHSDDPSQVRDYLRGIDGAGHRLLRTVDGMLDFSQIERGDLDDIRAPFEIDEVLDHAITTCRPLIGTRPIRLHCNLNDEAPRRWLGDADKLSRLLVNLLSNAIECTELGDVRVRIEVADPGMQIRISHSGIDITPEYQEQQARPHAPLAPSSSDNQAGIEFGPVIIKRVVELMQGELSVTGHEGQGAEVRVTLPLHPLNEPIEPTPESGPSDRAPRRILIAAQDSDDQRFLQRQLHKLMPDWPTSLIVDPRIDRQRPCARGIDRTDKDIWLIESDLLTAPELDALRDRSSPPTDTPCVLLCHPDTSAQCKDAHATLLPLCAMPPTMAELTKTIESALARERPTAAVPAPAQPSQGSALTTAPVRINACALIVEDNAFNQLIISEFLGQMGLCWDLATQGHDALRQLSADPDRYCLVLMDVQMPEMDGFEATRRIRRDLGMTELPIIALTAHAMEGDRERCLAAGMNDYLPKPIDQQAFVDLVRSWLPAADREEDGYCAAAAEAPSAAPAMPNEEPPVDFAVGTERAGGDAVFYRELCRVFIDNYTDKTAMLDADGIEARADDIRRLAHTLKSSAAILGANALAQTALRLDDHIKTHGKIDSGGCSALQRRLTQCLQALGDHIEAEQEEAPTASAAPEPASQMEDKARPRILVVDDEPQNIKLLQRALGDRNEVVSAGDGAQALQQAARLRPDLILLDVIMPGIDGYEVCRRLKAEDATRDIPIIFVTAQRDADHEHQGLALGAIDYIGKPFDIAVVRARVHNHLSNKLAGDRLEDLSLRDPLTGIANRRRFDAHLDQSWRQAKHHAAPIALVMIDVDRFKQYNDRYGHRAGDQCLIRLARVVADTAAENGGLGARIGGEEFAWILPGSDQRHAMAAATRLQGLTRALALPHADGVNNAQVSVSMGVHSLQPGEGDSPAQLIEAADANLYRAKAQGRDCIVPLLHSATN